MGKQEEEEEEKEEEKEGRREVAIVSTQSLQPNCNPIRGVTQDQLSKLRVILLLSTQFPFLFPESPFLFLLLFFFNLTREI